MKTAEKLSAVFLSGCLKPLQNALFCPKQIDGENLYLFDKKITNKKVCLTKFQQANRRNENKIVAFK